MRKITQQAINAFMLGEKFSSGNTQVRLDPVIGYTEVELLLHGNIIAKRFIGDKLMITNANWFTPVTKERLNGIPGVKINQKGGTWYLNGVEWNGDWITINPNT